MEQSAENVRPIAPGSVASGVTARAQLTEPESLIVDPVAVVRILGAIVLVLVGLSLITGATGVGDQIFMLDMEQNVPTYFSTIILATASALLLFNARLKIRRGARYRWHWLALSLVFLYLSMDELIGLHEMSTTRVERVVTTTGPFYYASTVVTGALVVIVALSFLRFFLHLPRRSAILFALAGGLFVGGALGAEMVGGMIDEAMGTDNTVYMLVTTLEETLEMSGVVVFIHALLKYLETEMNQPRLQVGGVPRV